MAVAFWSWKTKPAVSLMVAHLAVEAGATVIGPIADAATALTLVETEAVDCAVLDYKLIDGTSLPVADALLERGVPFLFASAYGSGCEPRFARCLAWRRSMCRAPVADDGGGLRGRRCRRHDDDRCQRPCAELGAEQPSTG